MVLMMREVRVEVRALRLVLPMLTTRTGHVVIRVDWRSVAIDSSTCPPERTDEPDISSEQGDLLVYYLQRAVYLYYTDEFLNYEKESPRGRARRGAGDGGTRSATGRHDRPLVTERLSELQRAEGQQRLMDRCMWTALRSDLYVAEQYATDNYQNTVIFEPYGGSFGVTRPGSRQFSWTNSQPMDLLDGYDLLGPAGRKLAVKVLTDHKPLLVLIAFDCRLWST